jgi:predicted acyltransferase
MAKKIEAVSSVNSKRRLDSIDALRGLTVAAMLLVNNAGDWDHVYPWLEHATWHGCTPPDFIFPFFLFIVGVSTTLALAPALEAGRDRSALLRQVLIRAGRIVLLGIALHLFAHWTIPGREFRLFGVLQRIGICFAIAGVIALMLRAAMQWALLAVLLVGYAALLLSGGSLAPDLNIVDRVDSAVLGSLAYTYDAATGHAHEPEGLLSTLGALATTLLGARAGAWPRTGGVRKIVGLGIACIAIGWLLSIWLPFNKQLWTPSFVLWTGGWAALAMAAAHALVDVRGWPAMGRSFGVNAIVAYAGSWAMVCVLAWAGWLEPWYRHVLGDTLTPGFGPCLPSMLWAVAFTAFWWGLMAWFDRRGWHIKI